MEQNDLARLYTQHPNFEPLTEVLLNRPAGKCAIGGLTGSSGALLIAALFNKLQTTHIVILPEKRMLPIFIMT